MKIDLFHIGGTKPILFFSEPSFFGLALAPFIVYQTIRQDKYSKFYLAYFLTWSIIVQSLTVFFVIILALILIIKTRYLIFLFAAISITLINIDYFSSRLMLSSSNNLSVLVYLQGWEMAFKYIIITDGTGVGFNQFGVNWKEGAYQEKIQQLYSIKSINLLDAGSLAPKIIGEFGLMGFLTIIIITFRIFDAFIKLKRNSFILKNTEYNIFFMCVIYTSCIEFFMRGAGYFTQTFFMLFIAIFFKNPIKH